MIAAPTSNSLAALFKELDGHRERVPLELLTERLRALEFGWDVIEPFVRFAPDTYRRNLMRAGSAYHALILCWRAGQRSPIHDHRGSSCGVRVLRGTCTETIFQRTGEGHIFPTRTRELPEGFCCGSQDADIHQISNLMPQGNDLITLHVYSPPLLVMGQYSLTEPLRTEVAEPIASFTAGAGI
jgi:cysteine dioxygenase